MKNDLGRVTSDELKTFANGIMELLKSSTELARADCCTGGRKLIKGIYDWDFFAKLLVESYEKLT